jgi:hypothetical protein
VASLREAKVEPRSSAKLTLTAGAPITRRSIDWLALGTGNDFAELICYRLSQHGVHKMVATGTNADNTVVVPEVTVVMPVSNCLFLLEEGKKIVSPDRDFPTRIGAG